MRRSRLTFWSMAAGFLAWATVLGLRMNPATDLSRLKSSDTATGAIGYAPATGAELYAVACASCHQDMGQGRHPVFPPLAASEWVTGDPGTLAALTLRGVSGPMSVNGVPYSGLMPAFDHLSDEELALVLSYIRTSWGNDASRLTAADVPGVRIATSGRESPWAAEELVAASGPGAER
jgi:mono/diheme cytochrome c family protein